MLKFVDICYAKVGYLKIQFCTLCTYLSDSIKQSMIISILFAKKHNIRIM